MISFIIPTLNEGKIIEETLESLLLYTGEKEIIVSDGHSSDKTVEIAERYSTVVRHDGSFRQTIAAGKNAGAKVAHGKYLVFLDADVSIPDINSFFQRAIDLFNSNDKLVGLAVPIKVLQENETIMDKIVFSIFNLFNYISNNIFRIGAAVGEFQMVRKDIFEKVGGYDEKLVASEDYDFFRKISKVGKTYFAKDIVIYHTGRRAHTIGWSRLLYQWISNGLSVLFFKKAVNKEWEEIR